MNKTLEKLIQSRRSVFPAQYTGEEIPNTDLIKILESARWAPNHRKTEPWRYKVLTGDAIDHLGDFMCEQFEENTGKPISFKLKKLKEKLAVTSAMILIFMHRDEKESVPEWEEIAAVSMSVQNMWLTTHDLGYGCYWSSPKDFVDMSKYDRIQTHEQEKFLGFFYLGTYSNQHEMELPQRKTIEEFVQFIN